MNQAQLVIPFFCEAKIPESNILGFRHSPVKKRRLGRNDRKATEAKI
ncbi:MAG: hypothetical protein ABH875_01115 [Candidatus Omnitrophota bacterium]